MREAPREFAALARLDVVGAWRGATPPRGVAAVGWAIDRAASWARERFV